MAEIFGDSNDNVLDGTNQNDDIYGLGGNDQLNGGDGQDALFGGAGDNIFIGGQGNDLIVLNYDVNTGGDLDPEHDGANILIFSPGDGEDIVEGFDVSKDKINLRGFGLESFANLESSIFIQDDTTYLAIEDPQNPSSYGVIVQLNFVDGQQLTADNFIFGDVVVAPEPEPEDQTIIGSEEADELTADDGDDVINGLGGDDVIDGKRGNDVISGGAGDDIIDGGFGADVIDGGEGIDTIDFGNRLNDAINVDLQTGETSEGDTLENIENITGGQSVDRLTGDDQDNIIDGQDGSDTLFGHGGNDTLLGGAGSDRLFGGSGADFLDGGAGNSDSVNYFHSAQGVNIDLSQGTASGGDAEGDTIINVENITASQFDDVLVGNSEDNVLSGWHGDDQLFGGDGDDRLSARNGNNVFVGGDGDDRIVGERTDSASNTFVFSAGDDADLIQLFDANTDVIDLSSYQGLTFEQLMENITVDGDSVVIDLGSGINGGINGDQITLHDFDIGLLTEDHFVFAEPEGVQLTGTDRRDQLNGTDYNDTLDGLRGKDTIFGGAGDDEIFGRQGQDRLYGGEGDDKIFAGSGRDVLFGDEGNDEIHFGRGSDTATGGTGDDLFVFSRGNRQDIITDFSDGDIIRLNKFRGVDDFDDVMANAEQIEDDVVITFGRDQLTLLDVEINTLTESDFIIG